MVGFPFSDARAEARAARHFRRVLGADQAKFERRGFARDRVGISYTSQATPSTVPGRHVPCVKPERPETRVARHFRPVLGAAQVKFERRGCAIDRVGNPLHFAGFAIHCARPTAFGPCLRVRCYVEESSRQGAKPQREIKQDAERGRLAV